VCNEAATGNSVDISIKLTCCPAVDNIIVQLQNDITNSLTVLQLVKAFCCNALHGNGDGSNTNTEILQKYCGFAGETCGNTAGMEWPVVGLPW